MQKTPKRAVVTGLGMVTPLGMTVIDSWEGIKAGRNSAAPIRHFDAASWPTNFSCEVSDFELRADAYLSEQKDFITRPTSFGLEAARQAMLDAGFTDGYSHPQRMGVAVGAGLGAVSPHILAQFLVCLEEPRKVDQLVAMMERQNHRFFLIRNHPGILATLLAERWNICGPVTTTHTACASSAQALGNALHMIERGSADVMLVGGADSLAGELLLAGFSLLGALSQRKDNPELASRPFDKDRDGFVAGEGAAFLIVEEEQHARKRGAKIYARFGGYGETMCAYRITDLPPDGRGIVEAMNNAVSSASLTWDEIGYINAHGTSTAQNDEGEAEAIRRAVGTHAMPFVSSTKSMIGHLISAAGAVEAVFSILALRDQVIPPNRNLFATNCGTLNLAPNTLTQHSFRGAVSNSFGFGGSNASLAFVKEDSHV